MANRTSGKILKGLQGTAAAVIIGRAINDIYKQWKGDSSSKDDDNSKNTKPTETKPRAAPMNNPNEK